eukprot:TRINITY_DN76690_c0_g1_i1.p1 TRINITY_DN76690_c0_g1~~TRINITY_DN76690_c0_g1_i1.p1  ORF type:complete len:307 (+),score=35.94 TRINITY_DN76690_c0_g1_i1:96-923(+)
MEGQPEHEWRRKGRVLVLGGWSPGPLDVLRTTFSGDVDFEEPSIPMPPSGCRWCLNPFWFFLLFYLFIVVPALFAQVEDWLGSGAIAWVLRGVIFVGSAVVVRVLVAGVVWFAVRDGVRVARGLIRSWEPDVVVGFSWGGGVASWLLADGSWSGPLVLLAPTLEKMRSIACLPVPKLEPVSGSMAAAASSVGLALRHVFHADGDPFCPESQLKVYRNADFEIHHLRDNHVLCGRASLDGISECLHRLLDVAASNSVAAVTAAATSSESAHSELSW